MPTNMGLNNALGGSQTCFFRKFRWLLIIDGVSVNGVNALPPLRSARPSLSFREFEVQHTTETIYYPAKVEWKPINLTLYDYVQNQNPVITWIKNIYDICQGNWNVLQQQYKKNARLLMLDGCGNTQETWVFQNTWPNNIEFGDLDMGNSDLCMIDLTLRYDRAYSTSNC